MPEAILVIAMTSMIHFTGNVPGPFREAAWNRFEGQRLVEQADKRMNAYIPNEIRILGANVALIIGAAYEQRIVLRTEF